MRWLTNVTMVVIAISLVNVASLTGQDHDEVFNLANTAYNNGDFEAARDAYQELWSRGINAGELAYNLGNCYYKLDQIGPAVLFYERASRLMPGDENVSANLLLATESIVDKIDARDPFFLVKWWKLSNSFLSYKLLLIMAIVFYGTLIVAIALLIWTRRVAILRGLAIVSGILCLVSTLLLRGQWLEIHRQDQAVIMTESVSVMSAPNEEMAVELFVIHEGLKVTIDQVSELWTEIILPDGKVGWVNKDALERI
ncbi:hypothetical protein KAR48_11770 [bacterium]|nr:hypothetical protein [bacterium]